MNSGKITGTKKPSLKDGLSTRVAKYGNNWQEIIYDLLKKDWQTLFKNYPILPSGKSSFLPEITIKIKDKKGENVLPNEKRYCQSCGNELNSAQRKDSKYCSSRFVGYERAYQCRNNNSNPRNYFKKKNSENSR